MYDFRIEVNSSAIKSIAYEKNEQILTVEFTSGGNYDYPNVPLSIVQGMLEADSIGRYFNQNIKPYGIKEFRK